MWSSCAQTRCVYGNATVFCLVKGKSALCNVYLSIQCLNTQDKTHISLKNFGRLSFGPFVYGCFWCNRSAAIPLRKNTTLNIRRYSLGMESIGN